MSALPPEEPPDPRGADPTTAAREEDVQRATIGPYVLLHRLGQGGMGGVWLAEQTHPFRRLVALKFIARGSDSSQVLARFDLERRVLAHMNHQNIAEVFDAGETTEGQPYFVMEYVKGLPITEYCDKHQLTTEDRIQLFVQVCAGVQHAHLRGVIHRDLKPSNVLVEEIDGQLIPKIIDFGIAKATMRGISERAFHTEQGVMVGTPEYMSPEQADASAEDVDARTDVYSLGVLFYEMLVGVLPLDPATLRRAGFEEIRHKIHEADPPTPSARLRDMGKPGTELAQRRRVHPADLVRKLRGDLDWIVMKALEKDRRRRYQSPAEMAADIERHLRFHPVLAGPPSWVYRTRRFFRRNRSRALATTLAALLGISAVAVLASVQQSSQAQAEATTARLTMEDLATLERFGPAKGIGLFDIIAESDSISLHQAFDRIVHRISTDRARPAELQRFATQVIRPQIRGLSLQQAGHSTLALWLEKPRVGPTDIGARLRFDVSANGHKLSTSELGDSARIALSAANVGAFRSFIRGLEAPGSYRVIGSVEVQLVRASPGRAEQPIGDPVYLPIPPRDIYVVRKLPENYPVVIRDPELCRALRSKIQIADCSIFHPTNARYTGLCEVRVPSPIRHYTGPLQFALDVFVATDSPRPWQVKVGGLFVSNRMFGYSPAALTNGMDVQDSMLAFKAEFDIPQSVAHDLRCGNSGHLTVSLRPAHIVGTDQELDYCVEVSTEKDVAVHWQPAGQVPSIQEASVSRNPVALATTPSNWDRTAVVMGSSTIPSEW